MSTGDGDGDDDDYCSVCDCHDSLCYGYYRCDTHVMAITGATLTSRTTSAAYTATKYSYANGRITATSALCCSQFLGSCFTHTRVEQRSEYRFRQML